MKEKNFRKKGENPRRFGAMPRKTEKPRVSRRKRAAHSVYSSVCFLYIRDGVVSPSLVTGQRYFQPYRS